MSIADILLWFIIVFIVFEYVFSRILDYLNHKHWSSEVPEEMKDVYDEEKYRKAQDYEKAKGRIGLISSTVSFILILGLLLFDGFAWLDEWVRQYTEQPIPMALLFFGVIGLVSEIISLPFSIYNTFVIEERFGFNKTDAKTFISDKLKGLLMSAVMGGGLLAIVILVYQWSGDWFWLIAWIIITGITLFFTMFYTSLIVPLFNELKPLEEGELRSAIERYAQKINFPLDNIYVIDGSKRSTKSNAFFSGIGKKKSIVLYDTLIENHSTEELTAVLAHEVGHYKKQHIQKSFIISSLQMAVMLLIFGWLAGNPLLAKILGAEQASFHLALLGFGLLYSPISLITGLLMNVFSRKNEYEADEFAKETYSSEPLRKALKKLSVDNLSNLTPHPTYVFVHYSHPPVLQRLQALKE
ncbi:MAG: peptidase M48 [Bacteroidetes bacterium SW_11_45_7]|nr:MAG: peptidase M48 [Bacteroidetes bacterium SW_11_45_7]